MVNLNLQYIYLSKSYNNLLLKKIKHILNIKMHNHHSFFYLYKLSQTLFLINSYEYY